MILNHDTDSLPGSVGRPLAVVRDPMTVVNLPQSACKNVSLPLDTAGTRALNLQSEEAAYLQEWGITDSRLHVLFKTGYCNGSMVEKASARQLAELQVLGLVKKTGREHFTACLVFPIFDHAGKVVHMYAAESAKHPGPRTCTCLAATKAHLAIKPAGCMRKSSWRNAS